MNIEERFLQKAIQDRNYISFIYKEKTYKKVLPLKLENKENKYLLLTKENTFEVKSWVFKRFDFSSRQRRRCTNLTQE